MTSLSDTLTVGLVLVLLFGSIALYLYTRIQQAEQKISLLESILLDLKMSSEIKSYTELPADEKMIESSEVSGYLPFDDEEKHSENYVSEEQVEKQSTPAGSVSSKDDESDVEQYKSIIADAVINSDSESLPSASKVTVNYESMTIKELQNLAKSRGISGAGSMKKGSIIEALKTSDRSQVVPIEPGSTATSSFLETSSPFLGSESQ